MNISCYSGRAAWLPHIGRASLYLIWPCLSLWLNPFKNKPAFFVNRKWLFHSHRLNCCARLFCKFSLSLWTIVVTQHNVEVQMLSAACEVCISSSWFLVLFLWYVCCLFKTSMQLKCFFSVEKTCLLIKFKTENSNS